MEQQLLIRQGSLTRSETIYSNWSETDIALDELKELHTHFVYSMVATGSIGRIYHDESITAFTEYKLFDN